MTQQAIYMGAGDHTRVECTRVHDRLDDGLSQLSASQQWTPPGRFGCPSGSTMDEWIEGQEKISAEIMAVIHDIASALGATVRRVDDEVRFILEVEMQRDCS